MRVNNKLTFATTHSIPWVSVKSHLQRGTQSYAHTDALLLRFPTRWQCMQHFCKHFLVQIWTKCNRLHTNGQIRSYKIDRPKNFRRSAVFIQPKINDDLRNRITEICMACECQISENMELATHIIYPEIDHQDDFIPNTFNLSVCTQIWFKLFCWFNLNVPFFLLIHHIIFSLTYPNQMKYHWKYGVFRPNGFFIRISITSGWMKRIMRLMRMEKK